MTATLARSAATSRSRVHGWQQFRVYWLGHLLSFTGDWFTILALPLIAVTISDSAAYVGLVAAAELIATPLVGMRMGALADRCDPRRTMLATNLVRAALLSGLALWIADTRPPLWVLPATAFVLSVLRDLHDSAENVMVTSVVPSELLVRANGRFQISDGAGHVVGALIAGAIAYRNPALALGVDAASFLISAGAVFAMGSYHVERAPEPPLAPWRATLHAMRTEDRYWRVIVTMAIANVTTACVLAPFVIFAERELRLNPFEIGVTWAVMGVGGFIAGVALDRVTSLRQVWSLVATTVLAAGIGVTGLAGSWVVTLVAFAAIGAILALGMATVGSMRHSSFPAHLQGRVTIATRIAFTAGVVPGLLVAGWLADLESVGPARMFVLFAFFAAIATGVGIALRVDRLPAPGAVLEDRFASLSAEDAAFWAESPVWVKHSDLITPTRDDITDVKADDVKVDDVIDLEEFDRTGGPGDGREIIDLTETPEGAQNPGPADVDPGVIEPPVVHLIRVDDDRAWSDRDPIELIAFALSQDDRVANP